MNSSTTLYDYSKRALGKKRYFKEIDKKDFHFLFDSSPLELLDSVCVYDVETFEYFMLIRFSRVTSRMIRSFKIRLFLYLDSPIPYKKLSFTYSVNKKKKDETVLGGEQYIPIPETYFKRYEIFIDEVEYDDGGKEKLSVSTLDFKKAPEKKHVEQIDAAITPLSTSERFPALVMPQFSENAWICTCGNKNLSEEERCTRCTRTKESQRKMLEKHSSSELEKDSYSLLQRAKKADFVKARNPEKTDAEKEEMIESEIGKVERRERYKDKMRVQALPRILAYFAAGYLIYLFLKWLETLS